MHNYIYPHMKTSKRSRLVLGKERGKKTIPNRIIFPSLFLAFFPEKQYPKERVKGVPKVDWMGTWSWWWLEPWQTLMLIMADPDPESPPPTPPLLSPSSLFWTSIPPGLSSHSKSSSLFIFPHPPNSFPVDYFSPFITVFY